MRNYPAGFVTEKNRVAGSRPAWILKLMVSGSPVYVSDRILRNFMDPETGLYVSTNAWVTSWGKITEGITGSLGEFSVGEFSVSLAVDPNDAANILYIVDNNDIESGRATLFSWYEMTYGQITPFPGQVVFSGYVKEIGLDRNDTGVNLTLQDDTLKIQGIVGGVVDLVTYPKADPDDVGKVIPAVIGSLKKFPTLAVDAGIKTGLTTGVSALAASIEVTDARGLAIGTRVQADDEQMTVISIAGSTLGVTRGVNGSVPVMHQRGAVVWEWKNEFVYVVADHAVVSIPKAYCKVGQTVLDISLLCTVWPGGDHPRYPGRAVISVPGYITVAQIVALAAALSGNVSKSGSASLTGDVTKTGSGTLGGNVTKTGSASLTGDVTKTGSASLSGAVSQTGGVTLSGLVSLTGGVSDPGHTHLTGTSSQQGTTTGLPTGYPAATAVNYGNGTYGISGNPNVFGLQLAFPAAGSRSDASYSITINFGANMNGVPFYFVVGGSIRYQITLNVVSGSPFSCTFSAGSISSDIVEVLSTAMTSSQFRCTAATRTIQLTSLVSSGASAVVTKGSLAASNGTLDTSSNIAVSSSGLSVADGTGVNNGLAFTDGIGVSNALTFTDSTGVSNSLTISDGIGVSNTLGVVLSGNSVANTLVGDAILVDVNGLADNSPQATVAWLLSRYGGYTGAVSTVGNFPAGYSINGAITESNTVLYWVNRIAFEFRAFFKFQMGTAKLIVRPDAFVSAKTIIRTQIDNFERVRSPYEDIINTINLRYDRDYSQARGVAAYRGTKAVQDAGSIAKYGEREKSDIFFCNFITNPVLAASVAAFYLTWYAARHWTYTLDCFLDQVELEFGDQVATELKAGIAGMVRESGISPGNNDMDRVDLKLEI